LGGELSEIGLTAPRDGAPKCSHPAHHNLDVLNRAHKKTSNKLATMRLGELQETNPVIGFCQ